MNKDHFNWKGVGHLFLFCGRKRDRMKALYWEGDGFVLLYKRLESGQYQWPMDAEAVRSITPQEFRWLLEERSIHQPKVVKKLASLLPYRSKQSRKRL
ncbi:IS66 family insertion sequence element accessory protein TnpB [Paenibacillus tuaregi]|uniref:IS66 family insertion sequence element accessory protein TnpB n=1 Tax=Paenibacillus tuaregi TaxID=1816681 RepID=UPI0009EECB70|nr:IS66 family insertion sequence element accessory protein TnpB [Paenibacillus tuaregi]